MVDDKLTLRRAKRDAIIVMGNYQNTQLVPDFVALNKLGNGIKVQVRQSNKAKHTSIRINHQGNAELVLPANKNIKEGYKFLLKNEFWVREKLQKLLNQSPLSTDIIPILDEKYILQNIIGNSNKINVKQNIIEVYSNCNKHNEILIKFLKHRLLEEIIKFVSILSQKYNLVYSKIKLTNNKSRWGSCSSKAVLSFNWRLVFAPLNIVEYIVVHEMCHLV